MMIRIGFTLMIIFVIAFACGVIFVLKGKPADYLFSREEISVFLIPATVVVLGGILALGGTIKEK